MSPSPAVIQYYSLDRFLEHILLGTGRLVYIMMVKFRSKLVIELPLIRNYLEEGCFTVQHTYIFRILFWCVICVAIYI